MSHEFSWSASKSLLNCPFSNLAWEEHLLKGNFDGDAHFFFYRNTPSIVLGRFQVPWREINFIKLKELNERNPQTKIDIVRRRSGGGTVYHDMGNWNFCFVRKQRDLSRLENLGLIRKAMASLGIDLEVNERFDLILKESLTDGSTKSYKVSGCAFKQKKETSLHHGTLLVDANLDFLKGVLGHPPEWHIEGKGIKSTPSPVCNLLPHSTLLNFDGFFEVMCQQLNCKGAVLDSLQGQESAASELAEWSWLWGETPEFSVSTSDIELSAKKGVLTRAVSQRDDRELDLVKDKEVKLMDTSSWEVLRHSIGDVADKFAPFFP